MDMINVKINGVEYSVPAGSTVLEAARYAGIDIPTLCYLKDVNEIGACRLCLVEVTGARGMVAACVYPTNDGMEIFTNTDKLIDCMSLIQISEISFNDFINIETSRRSGCQIQ